MVDLIGIGCRYQGECRDGYSATPLDTRLVFFIRFRFASRRLNESDERRQRFGVTDRRGKSLCCTLPVSAAVHRGLLGRIGNEPRLPTLVGIAPHHDPPLRLTGLAKPINELRE